MVHDIQHNIIHRLQKFYKTEHAVIFQKYIGMKQILWREILGFEHSKNT